jgi:hypothetical protein
LLASGAIVIRDAGNTLTTLTKIGQTIIILLAVHIFATAIEAALILLTLGIGTTGEALAILAEVRSTLLIALTTLRGRQIDHGCREGLCSIAQRRTHTALAHAGHTLIVRGTGDTGAGLAEGSWTLIVALTTEHAAHTVVTAVGEALTIGLATQTLACRTITRGTLLIHNTALRETLALDARVRCTFIIRITRCTRAILTQTGNTLCIAGAGNRTARLSRSSGNNRRNRVGGGTASHTRGTRAAGRLR